MIASSSRERAQRFRFSQAWKPDLDTPSVSQSHAAGQTERCFAMKPNFMSTPSRSRLRPFLRHVALRLELCDLTPEPVDLQLLGLHLTVSGKRLLRIRAKFLHPFAKNVLVDVDGSRRLRHAYASLTHQADRLDLELSTALALGGGRPPSWARCGLLCFAPPATGLRDDK